MIKIDFTSDEIAGEPGPNFYWRGNPKEFLSLVNDLHTLGRTNGISIELNRLEYVEIQKNFCVSLKSSENSKTLCKYHDNRIEIDIDNKYWRRVMAAFLWISFSPSHEYVDFEDVDMEEDANFIVSSEF